jgi:hypothetical protein
MRKTLRTIVAVLLAVFTIGAVGEAAPRKVVRHRVRHRTRVGRTAAIAKKKTTRLAHATSAKTRKIVNATTTKTRKIVNRRSTKPK